LWFTATRPVVDVDDAVICIEFDTLDLAA
jgi:hypothetical protein